MANFVQIPNLPSAVALNGSEQFEGVQSGVSVKITAQQLATLATLIGSTWLPAGSHFTIGQPTTGFGEEVAPFAQFGGYGGMSAPHWFGRGIQLDFPAQIYTDTTSAGQVNSVYIANWGQSNIAFLTPTTVNRAAMIKVNPVNPGTNATILNSFCINTSGNNLFDGLNGMGSVSPEAKAHIGGNVDIPAWTTIGRNFIIDSDILNDTTTAPASRIEQRAASSIGAVEFGFTLGASVIGNAYNLLFNGPPIAGINATIEFPWAIGVRGGAKSRFGVSLNPIATTMHYVTVMTDSEGALGTSIPNGFMVHDVSVGGAWDMVRPWGVLDFSSDDETELGRGIRARIGTVMEDVEGRRARLTISTAPTTAGVLVDRLTVTGRGNILTSDAALATTATDGFFYLSTSAGQPTGVPTAYPGVVSLCYDTVNQILWIYSGGAWISSSGSTGISRVITAAGAVTMTSGDGALMINKTVGAATTVNLSAPTLGARVVIKDMKGDAGTNNITLDAGSGKVINGLQTLVMNANYGATYLIGMSSTAWGTIV